jgi:hypothetical protein
MRLHYSTWQSDVLRQDSSSIAYRNYSDDSGSLPYEYIAQTDQGKSRLIPDQAGNRILFSFPFYDSFDVFRGTTLFSLSVRAVGEKLVGEGRLKAGENISVITDPAGIVTGAPVSAAGALIARVSSIWNEGLLNLTALDSSGSASSLALISAKTSLGIFVGHLVDESLFAFPPMMKILLLASFFLTVYLTVFLLFNLRQDSFTIVQNRLKQLQISLIEQYYDRKNDIDWGHWSRELEQRRDEIRSELTHGLGIEKNKDAKKDIDTLIDKSWDELLSVIGGRKETGIDEAKLQTILNKILAAPGGIPGAAQVQAPQAPQAPAVSGAPAEAVEELEELDSDAAEEVEELTDVEAEELLEEAEPIEELEELADDEPVEEIEAMEELPEAELPTEPGVAAARPFGVTPAPGGDDNAPPYIVETSGLKFANEDIDKAMEAMKPESDEPAELEELEELEELDEDENGIAEEVEDPEDSKKPSHMSEMDLAALASKIEFSTLSDTDDEESSLEEDLEIVSPFATMLSGFDDEGGAAPAAAKIKAEAPETEQSKSEGSPPQEASLEVLEEALPEVPETTSQVETIEELEPSESESQDKKKSS